jgi:hypothetical protein
LLASSTTSADVKHDTSVFFRFPFRIAMNGKYIRLTPPPDTELHQNGKPFAQFDPKTIYLVEGADPIILGRASSRDNKRLNDPDNGYLKVPTGQTALGREHALLCVRNDTVSSLYSGNYSENADLIS